MLTRTRAFEPSCGVVQSLRGAALQRTNAAKLAFGADGVVKSTDPKQSWKAQQVAAAQRKAALAAGGGGGGGGGAAAAVAAPVARGSVEVSASDVLFVLDGERGSSKSRVVQWWQCNQAPLSDEAKQAARLFPPPPPPTADGGSAAAKP